MLAGGGILWVGVIGALGWGFVKKRRRAKAILTRWAEEEAIEDALLAQRAREARRPRTSRTPSSCASACAAARKRRSSTKATGTRCTEQRDYFGSGGGRCGVVTCSISSSLTISPGND